VNGEFSMLLLYCGTGGAFEVYADAALGRFDFTFLKEGFFVGEPLGEFEGLFPLLTPWVAACKLP
jgi:hypothetical protein